LTIKMIKITLIYYRGNYQVSLLQENKTISCRSYQGNDALDEESMLDESYFDYIIQN
jgi:hypothetical protein